MIKRTIVFIIAAVISVTSNVKAQTAIPNPGFENWTTTGNYTNPTGWDTPNEELMSIPFFGFPVVTKSTDHQGTGSFSAKLETKHLSLPPLDVPGFMTCGKIVVDITSGSFVLSGGVPVVDQPTHLKGFFKYFPKGGDSCVIGIGLTRTTGGVQDTIGLGSFSTKDTVADWTPFSAWIDYIQPDMPDTMNIIALSTAQEVMTAGTTLYVDNLYLDYTVSTPEKHTPGDILVYNDREAKRLIIFPGKNRPEDIKTGLYDMTGRCLVSKAEQTAADRLVIPYQLFPKGIYLLEVSGATRQMTKKFFLNP